MAPDHARRVDAPRRVGGAGALTDPVVRAVRGATSVAEDTSEAILESTAELLAEVIARNELAIDDLDLDHLHDDLRPLGRVPRRRRPRGGAHDGPAPLRRRDPGAGDRSSGASA